MKVGVVGAGNVGAAAAYAMALRGSASEIVLIDRNHKLAVAQAQDILHSTPFAHATRVRAGSYHDLADAAVVILAAGVNQQPGESRLALLERNRAVFSEIVPSVRAHCDPIFLVATNPVDVMTWVTARLSGAADRVIGSGTILDTARFRALIGTHLGVAVQSVHAHVVGEHGDSEVLCWSTASIGGIPLSIVAEQLGRGIDLRLRGQIDRDVRQAAYAIIEGKGATWFGIGAGLARIVEAIGADERALLTVSACLGREKDVAISLPRLVGRTGIVKTLDPKLNEQEEAALGRSVDLLRGVIRELPPDQHPQPRGTGG